MSSAAVELPTQTAAPELLKEPGPDRAGSILSISKHGYHRFAYVEFGDPKAERVVICVHGLSRQGRDFDRLASALAAKGWWVICPDLVGRGRSEWLKDPEEYNLPQYQTDLMMLISRLGVSSVDWIGTSLGGLIGMVLAGQHGTPIKRLVVNDIGPFLPWQALHRLAGTVRSAPHTFPSFQAVVDHYRKVLAPFGDLSDQEWHHLAEFNVTRLADGTFRVLSDPDITAAFKPGWFFNLSLWNYWDQITCPTMVLHGTESDLLLPATVREMATRGPKGDIYEVPGCGHAPALMNKPQIAAISNWLETNHPVSA